MTDKQIIIDGVDVNSLYSEQIACMNRYEVATLFIKTVELLVAKEQECEELRKELEKAIQEEANTFLDLFKTEKELGYLKEALKKEFITYRLEDFVSVFTYKGYELDKLIEKNHQLKAENKNLKDHLELETEMSSYNVGRLNNYKQAIKKIKEIIHFNKTNRLSGGACISIEQILQICDEVLK